MSSPPRSVRFASLRRWDARDIAPLASLAVLVVFFSIASPGFLRMATVTALLKQGAVLAIVSAGLTFVLLCGEIDLSVGTTALWAAYLCGWMFHKCCPPDEPSAVPAWMTAAFLVLPLVSCLAMGMLSGGLTIWSRLPSFIITLAMMFIAEGSARFLSKSAMFRMPPLLADIGNEGIPLGDFTLPYCAILAAAVFLLAHFVLEYTRFGRYVYATGGNRTAARLAGLRTGWIVTACLAVGAVAAGLGGMVNAGRMSHINLDQNKDLLLSAVACVVLGGTSLFGGEGGIGKTLVGVLTFTVLNVGLMQIRWIDDLARQLLTGIVLMVALVINGLLSKRR